MARTSITTGPSADERWFQDQLRPMWIERSGFPDGSLGLPLAGEATTVETAASLSITDRQLDDAVAFLEFLAGESFTETERDQIRQVSLEEFRLAPDGAMQQLLSVRRAVAQIGRMTPIERARQRTAASTRIGLAEKQADVVSTAMSIVYRYNPIVLADVDRGYVITSDMFLAWGGWRQMIAAIVGLPPDQVWKANPELRRLERELPSWTDPQINSLVRAYEAWITLRVGLRTADAFHREELADALRREISGPADVERVAHAMAHIVHVTDLVDAVSRMAASAGTQA